ncbi:SMP-30/gluconolactonase/LRE family protein, partial [uncultured Nitratireductor sp.]|uniref:SMP-30/gluconolactonase/LRE family protein n=1 Tax=uncultured Nitratireductor sp. TaxID=520953 RepID=UPI00345AA8C2
MGSDRGPRAGAKDMTGRIKITARTQAIIGESPVWSARRQRLLWIDILGGQFHSYDPESGRDAVTPVPAAVGLL